MASVFEAPVPTYKSHNNQSAHFSASRSDGSRLTGLKISSARSVGSSHDDEIQRLKKSPADTSQSYSSEDDLMGDEDDAVEGFNNLQTNARVGPGGRPGSVVNTLRKYITHGDGTAKKDHAKGSALPVELEYEGPTGVMRVKYSKVARTPKQPSWLYPYVPLSEQATCYRGYPVDGPAGLKNTPWKVQIVGAALGPPPEPLPQFPQEELLGYCGGKYEGRPAVTLSETQVAWNSGSRWTEACKAGPTSHYFFTSGYEPGSAKLVQKPFPETIYHTVVGRKTVQVPVDNYSNEKALKFKK